MPTTHVVLSPDTFQVHKIHLREPRKDSDLYFSKITYDQQKLFITIPSAHIQSLKDHGDGSVTLYVKLQKHQIKLLLELDETVIGITKERASDWFNNGLTESIIEEYYTSCITVKKDVGKVLRLNIKNINDVQSRLKNVEYPLHCNITLHLTGLRFYKKKFSLVWTLEDVEPQSPFFSQSEDEMDILSDDEGLLGPDQQEFNMIRDELKDRVLKTLNEISKRIADLKCVMAELDEKRSLIEGFHNDMEGSNITFHQMDRISTKLDECGV